MSMTAIAVRKSRKRTPLDLVRTFSEVREELLGTLLMVLGSHDDAQDVAQEAFLKCWRARRKLPRIRNMKAWIFRVALNAAKDLQRNAWRRKIRPLEQAVPPEPLPCVSPAELLLHREELEQLRIALTDLRPEERDVFLLRQNAELTYEQIADLRERPIGTVKTQMRAALQKLRKVLHEPVAV
jgi:RNA polymerase sigma-70 factor, ECF subfamily